LLDDVFDYFRGGRRGEGEHRRPPERADRVRESEIGGAEVVSPLRNAVRLVDDEEGDSAGAEHVEVLRVLQALGRDVDEIVRARSDLLGGFPDLPGGERGIELRHVDPRCLRLLLLILHQRDER
jgi:hypothetical protein